MLKQSQSTKSILGVNGRINNKMKKDTLSTPKTIDKDLQSNSKFKLRKSYSSKLNTEECVAAGTRISQDAMFHKVINDRTSIDEIVRQKKQQSEEIVEAVQKYFQKAKDPLKASIRTLNEQGALSLEQGQGFVDPALKAFINEASRKPKEISFEDRVERMFKKINVGATKYSNQFKNTNYDMDTQVSCFINSREMRRAKRIARERQQELDLIVVPPSDNDESTIIGKSPEEKQADYEKRIENIFKWHPIQKTRYTHEVVDLCIPDSPVIPQAQYNDIVEDKVKVDQIAHILIRYNKLPTDIMEKLCFVIPKIDSWDFAGLRDGKKELRHLRSKILGIPTEWNVNMEDIDSKVSELEKQIAMNNPKYEQMLEKKNAASLIPFLSDKDQKNGEDGRPSINESIEPTTLFKLKTLVPNSGHLKNSQQLYRVIRKEVSGQIEIKPVMDSKNSARDLFLQHMDDMELYENKSRRNKGLKHKNLIHQKVSEEHRTPQVQRSYHGFKLLEQRSEETVQAAHAQAQAHKEVFHTGEAMIESRMGGELQAKLVQQLKIRKQKMLERKEVQRQIRLKKREQDAFQKRLTSSIDHNLVSQRVYTSLSSDLQSPSPIYGSKYRIQFEKFPKDDRIKLQNKPRPRNFYQPPSELKALQRKARRYERQSSTLSQWYKPASVDSLQSLPIDEEDDDQDDVLNPQEIINFTGKDIDMHSRTFTTQQETSINHAKKMSSYHQLGSQTNFENIALKTPNDSDERNQENKTDYFTAEMKTSPEDRNQRDIDHNESKPLFSDEKIITIMKKPGTASDSTNPRQNYSRTQNSLQPGVSNANKSRLFTGKKPTSSARNHHKLFISETKIAIESAKKQDEKDMYYKSSVVGDSTEMNQQRKHNPSFTNNTTTKIKTQDSSPKATTTVKSRSNNAFPVRMNAAMRPQSGIPLSSRRVVPKNLERKMYGTTFLMPFRVPSSGNARTRQQSRISEQEQNESNESSMAIKDQNSVKNKPVKQQSFFTVDSQAASTSMGSLRGHNGLKSQSSMVRHKEQSKSSLEQTEMGSEAFKVMRSESVDFSQKHGSLGQVDVSNRFMSICENLGIPVNKSRASHQNGEQQHKSKRKQQLLFSVNNPESYYTGSLWNAHSATSNRINETAFEVGPTARQQQTRNQKSMLSHDFNIHVQDDNIKLNNPTMNSAQKKMSQTLGGEAPFLDLQRNAYIDYDLMMKNATNVKITEKEVPITKSHYDMLSPEDEFQQSIQQTRLVGFLENEDATSITLTATGIGTDLKLQEEENLKNINSSKMINGRKSTIRKKPLRRVKTTATLRQRTNTKRKLFYPDQGQGLLRIDSKQTILMSRQRVQERNVPSTLRNSSAVRHSPAVRNSFIDSPQKVIQKSILRPKTKSLEQNNSSSKITSEKRINFSEHEDNQATLLLANLNASQTLTTLSKQSNVYYKTGQNSALEASRQILKNNTDLLSFDAASQNQIDASQATKGSN